jgi:hypothetical protein
LRLVLLLLLVLAFACGDNESILLSICLNPLVCIIIHLTPNTNNNNIFGNLVVGSASWVMADDHMLLSFINFLTIQIQPTRPTCLLAGAKREGPSDGLAIASTNGCILHSHIVASRNYGDVLEVKPALSFH